MNSTRKITVAAIDTADEALMPFNPKVGVKVRISAEIEAESLNVFGDGVQRSVRENCSDLKLMNRAFED